MKHTMKCMLVVAALGLSGMYANAAPLSDLSAGQTGRIEFNSITPQSIWSYARKNTTDTKSVTVWGDLLMPKNTIGKVPAVIYSHGSTGATAAAFDVWAKELNNAGVAMFVVDSYKPRGISETQTNQDQVSPGGQIADALNALKLLATHPKIDASRIYNMGFSRGGSIAYYTAWPMYQRPVDTAGAKFAGHIAVYPGVCEIRYRADASDKATAPIFMALGTKDDIINESTCKQYMAEVAANGNNVTVKSLPRCVSRLGHAEPLWLLPELIRCLRLQHGATDDRQTRRRCWHERQGHQNWEEHSPATTTGIQRSKAV